MVRRFNRFYVRRAMAFLIGAFVASLVIRFGDRTPAKETETHD